MDRECDLSPDLKFSGDFTIRVPNSLFILISKSAQKIPSFASGELNRSKIDSFFGYFRSFIIKISQLGLFWCFKSGAKHFAKMF